MGYGPPRTVEAQPRVGLPFGLFSVLTLRPDEDNRWANGIQWQAMSCGPVAAIEDPDCTTFGTGVGQFEKDFDSGSLVPGEAESFTVYGTDKCGTPGGRAFADGEENATAKLLAREEAQAEAAVWKRLAAAATDVNPSGALKPKHALAALERWLGAQYGSLGVIHTDRGAATLLDTTVNASGSRLLTKVGTPVVAGAGYPSTSPAGVVTADVSWIMASPALFGYRGQVFTSSALDMKKNDHYAVAERQYVVGFDPCGVAAVRMDLTA
jgi:hypothetical protein